VTQRNDDREWTRLLAVDPTRLPREDLIALVRDLQAALSGRRQPDGLESAGQARPSARAVVGADYTLAFDGGSLGNPGLGYGSFEVVARDGVSIADGSLEFGDGMTNNQAEFRALIAGLEALLVIVGASAKARSLAVRGDSQLVIRGLTGEWRVKHPGLQPLHRQASELLHNFGSVDLAWHPRRESVRTFGH
jgi:ribonuclease HI